MDRAAEARNFGRPFYALRFPMTLISRKTIACDTETNGTFFSHGCRPFMVTACDEDGETFVWEWEVDPLNREVLVDKKDVRDITNVLRSYGRITMHNAKFDYKALRSVGVELDYDKIDDTFLMSHAIDSEGPHGLKHLSLLHLGVKDEDEEELKKAVEIARRYGRKYGWCIAGNTEHPSPQLAPLLKAPHGSGWGVLDYWTPKAAYHDGIEDHDEFDTVCEKYAVRDVERSILLWMKFQATMTPKMRKAYELNRSILPAVTRMEENGMSVRLDRLDPMNKEIDRKVAEAGKKCLKIGGVDFNKTQKVATFLFGDCGIPPKSMTKTGGSTKADDLKEIYREIEHSDDPRYKRAKDFLFNFIGAKRAAKSKTFLAKYRAAHIDSVLYPNINICGTDTTRFSCDNPNLQQVAKNQNPWLEEIGIEAVNVRGAFGPRPGRVWITIDYVQLQLYIFAYIANAKAMIAAFEKGIDAHTATQMAIFKDKFVKGDEGQRRIAKNTNFAFVFGASPAKLELTAGMPGLWETVKAAFPEAVDYLHKTKNFVIRNGYVETAGGYRLTCRKPHAGVNYEVQGTEGEIVKTALRMLDDAILGYNEAGGDCKLIMNVHDEMIFDVAEDEALDFLVPMLQHYMEDAGLKYGVPCKTDVKIVRSTWDKGEKFVPKEMAI
jgi:DNA polymerase I-like protein with 3'-5' exonuclease and polymerase domains